MKIISGRAFTFGYPEVIIKNLEYYDDKKIKQYFVKPKLLLLNFKIAISKKSSKQMPRYLKWMPNPHSIC